MEKKTIEVPVTLLHELAKVSEAAAAIIQEQYPEATRVVLDELRAAGGISGPKLWLGSTLLVEKRLSGPYSNAALWLSYVYNWELKKDDVATILIPTRNYNWK